MENAGGIVGKMPEAVRRMPTARHETPDAVRRDVSGTADGMPDAVRRIADGTA